MSQNDLVLQDSQHTLTLLTGITEWALCLYRL